MKLLFVYSHKFIKAEQNYYTTGQFPYELFKTRYLNLFEKVTVCSRVLEITDSKNFTQSNGDNVVIKSLPNLSTLKRRGIAHNSTRRKLEKEIKDSNFVVARMPSAHAYIAMKIAMKWNKPLVVEVVGDVFESLWNHGNIVGKFLAPILAFRYRRIIRLSKYTIYVTVNQLQHKYPSAIGAYTINASNVEIDKASQSVLYRRIVKERNRPLNTLNIGIIGSYATKYKGIQNAIDLIAYLRNQKINANLHVLGSGKKSWLLKRAKTHGISENIKFYDLLPAGEPVLKWLDEMDLYIQPSLTEGLPRALIEAMSRGLPAVASNVGGIPELLEPKLLHKPNDSEDLISRVLDLIQNKERMLNQIEKNFIKAQDYTAEILRKRRYDFWKYVIKEELS